MSFAELARRALLGTRAETTPLPTAATGQPDIDAALHRLARPESPAASLLRQAALLTLAERAGRVPDCPSFSPVEPCPDDNTPPLPKRAEATLRRVLNGFLPQLTAPLVEATAAYGYRVPPALLPGLLEWGKQGQNRPYVRVVACHKAHWLAAQNPDWRYLVDPDRADAAFDTGTPAERREALRQLRSEDPAAARQRLESAWKQEPPTERAGLIAALAEGLSQADEPFLEGVLDDRRKEVRQAAAALLARLPESRLVARMRERLLTCLKLRASTLEIELPAECDAAMERDGIDKKPNLAGLGERAGWLAQMLACVPPSEWCRQFEVSEARLLTLFRGHEFATALDRGLAAAIGNFREAGFARLWLESTIENNDWWPDLFSQVVVALPGSADLTGLALHALRRNHEHILEGLLRLSPTPWDDALSTACLKAWRDPDWQRYQAPYAPQLRTYLTLAQVRLPPRPDFIQGWDTLAPGLSSHVGTAVDEFVKAMELRIRFIQALEKP